MKRRVSKMSDPTQILLPANENGFDRAVDIWRSGGLVAFPTETVYGLGADARNDGAVAGIFEAKERPSFNPLIVHVPSIEVAKTYVAWSDAADILARAFWPGPLTLVLPLNPTAGISQLVTNGKDTLAIRVPAHPVAQSLLAAFGGPIAAPSANPSGRISPTEPNHVLEGLGNRIDAIMDAGPCDVGVESTIIGLFAEPHLLRPGGLPLEMIEQALGHDIQPAQTNVDRAEINAPGQLASHYAPNATMRLNATSSTDDELLLGFGEINGELNLSASGDLREAAANLFGHLHKLDDGSKRPIAVAPIPDHGLGRAINDRLVRAAAPRD